MNMREAKQMKRKIEAQIMRQMTGVQTLGMRLREQAWKKEPGIDGILVTVGLCIIALLLCVVMKDSLTSFIQTIVTAMQTKAANILSGV